MECSDEQHDTQKEWDEIENEHTERIFGRQVKSDKQQIQTSDKNYIIHGSDST